MELMGTFIVIPQTVCHMRVDDFNCPLGKLEERKKVYIGILDRQVLSSTILAAKDNNLPLHPAIFFSILSTKGLISSLLSF